MAGNREPSGGLSVDREALAGRGEQRMSGDKYAWSVGESPPVLDPHSAAKHDLVRTYLSRYIDILTSDPRQDLLNITLVDGFAGGGEYLYRGQLVPGSPMILLQEIDVARANIAHRKKKQFRLNAEFFFVEQRRSNFAFLQDTLGRSPYAALVGESVHLRRGRLANEIDGIIQHIRARGTAHRSIFLFDQYGYNQVTLGCIRQILAQLNNPEIILNFNVDWLINYLSEKDTFLKGVVPVELDVNHVREMLAMKDQRHARWFIQHFLYNHIVRMTGAPFYTCFYVVSPESNRSYWLLHLSGHPRARDEMARRHWAMSTHSVHQGQAGLNMLGFVPERDIGQIPLDYGFDVNAAERTKSALMTELPSLIFDRRVVDAPPSLGQLFGAVCNQTAATVDLVSESLVRLRAENEIEIVGPDGRPKPRSKSLSWRDVIRPAAQRSMFSTVWPVNPARGRSSMPDSFFEGSTGGARAAVGLLAPTERPGSHG